MLRKVLVPVMFLSVGVFSTTMFFAGCSSDSTTGGTGGKGGAGTGGKGTGGGAVGTGGAPVGTGGAPVGTGGAAVTTGGAGGTVLSTGGAGGTVVPTGGAGGAVGTGGSAGAGGARTGGAGGARTGGAGGAAGGMSGAAGGAGGAATGGAGGGMVWATTAGACMNPLPDVTVVEFCSYYMTKCSDAYGTAVHQFANLADCMTKYTAYTATQKGCTAYHLCVAGTSTANATAHCPHPAGGTSNPCTIP